MLGQMSDAAHGRTLVGGAHRHVEQDRRAGRAGHFDQGHTKSVRQDKRMLGSPYDR